MGTKFLSIKEGMPQPGNGCYACLGRERRIAEHDRDKFMGTDLPMRKSRGIDYEEQYSAVRLLMKLWMGTVYVLDLEPGEMLLDG